MARPFRSQNKDKPYRDALRIELAAAGEDMKALRAIARAHIEKARSGDMTAIKEIADRLDGKPGQSMDMTTHYNKPLREYTDEELTAMIAELEAGRAEGDSDDENDPEQRN
jgi:hypothetical protein